MSPWDLLGTILIGLVLSVIFGPVVPGFIRRRYESTNRVECALRRDQPDELITGRWRPALATLSSGRIDIQPRNSFGLRLNSGAPFVIPVISAWDTGRQTPWSQAWRAIPGLQILTLTTVTGPIELAVAPQSVQRLLSKVDLPAQ
jgi:hypothetical protein